MMARQDEKQEERRQWHLDKTFSISHMLTTLSIVGSIFVVGSKFDTRVTVVEQVVSAQRAIDARQDSDIAESRRSIKEDLRDITSKLDRVIERIGTQKESRQ